MTQIDEFNSTCSAPQAKIGPAASGHNAPEPDRGWRYIRAQPLTKKPPAGLGTASGWDLLQHPHQRRQHAIITTRGAKSTDQPER
jgi:hypothetical protein